MVWEVHVWSERKARKREEDARMVSASAINGRSLLWLLEPAGNMTAARLALASESVSSSYFKAVKGEVKQGSWMALL